jgi:hypothetical protein
MGTNLGLSISTGGTKAISILNDHDHNGEGRGNPINSQYIINTPSEILQR